MRRLRYSEKGFTLIEVLVVIVVLGILAAVVALNVGGFLGTGTKEAAIIEKDTMQVAILGAMRNKGSPTLTAQTTLDPNNAMINLTIGGDVDLISDGYLVGTIKGSYTVAITGAISYAQYPAVNPLWEWDPTNGWIKWTSDP